MFKVTCHKCNGLLYEGEIQPLDAILEGLSYQCPKCKRKIPNPAKPKKVLANGKTLPFRNTEKPTVQLRQKQKWWRQKK